MPYLECTATDTISVKIIQLIKSLHHVQLATVGDVHWYVLISIADVEDVHW